MPQLFIYNSNNILSALSVLKTKDSHVQTMLRTPLLHTLEKAEHTLTICTMWNVVSWESGKLLVRMLEMSLWFSLDQSTGGPTKHPPEALCLYSCCFQDGIDWLRQLPKQAALLSCSALGSLQDRKVVLIRKRSLHFFNFLPLFSYLTITIHILLLLQKFTPYSWSQTPRYLKSKGKYSFCSFKTKKL